MMRYFLLLSPILLSASISAQSPRYFYQGDGQMDVIGGEKKLAGLSGRLVTLLDYLQDHFTQGQGKIEIFSGYRSPAYNEQLRRQEKLAAKASLHIEGMAADFTLQGVRARDLWHYIRQLNCCGAGYYSDRMVHVDTGPVRFWDQKTSKVFTDISTHNKQIYLTTEYDIYHPAETITLRLVRITEFPFGIQGEVEVVDEKGGRLKKGELGKGCRMIANRNEAQNFTLTLPKGLPKNRRLQIKFSFCAKPSQEMPDFVLSNTFVIH